MHCVLVVNTITIIWTPAPLPRDSVKGFSLNAFDFESSLMLIQLEQIKNLRIHVLHKYQFSLSPLFI